MAAFMERLDCKLADDDESDEKSDDSKASLMTDTEKSAINCYVLIQACSSYRYNLGTLLAGREWIYLIFL